MPAVRRPGIGFVLAALLSTFLALAAQAQTDTGSGTSSTVPTLTIVSSSATATEGEEVTYTVTAGSAPSSALPVVVHVRAHGEVMDTRTVAEVFLPAGATTVTLRLEEFTDEIAESPVNVTLTLAAGTGYSVGDPSEATVSIDYPSISDVQATPAPTPTPAVSPPDAPSGVSISAPSINSFTVSWTAEAGKTYRVEREAAFLFSYRVWQTVANDLSSGSFTENGLPCDLFYVYQVRAKVTGSAYGPGSAAVGFPRSCTSSTDSGARSAGSVRALDQEPPQLRLVTDNPTQTSIQIRLLLHGLQFTPIPLGLDRFRVDRSDRGTMNLSGRRKEGPQSEFHWEELECGSGYYFRAQARGNGTVYQDGGDVYSFRIIWGPWSDESPHGLVGGTTRGCTAPEVTVIPLFDRMARIKWSANPNASGYEVHAARTPGTISSSSHKICSTSSSTTMCDISLDNIVGSQGLAHLDSSANEGFRIRVKVNSSNPSLNNMSTEVIIRDGPSVTVDGHSSNGTTATVKWKPPTGAIDYFVRWRKLADTDSHDDKAWQLGQYTSTTNTYVPGDPTPTPSSVSSHHPNIEEHEISGLTPGALYAVQVVYRTSDGWFFSGRDAFVWPSSDKPGRGARVAGYPFAGHFASKDYTYKICESTFPTIRINSASNVDWAELIKDAVMQWEKATNGEITVSLNADDCPTYGSYSNVFTALFQFDSMIRDDRANSEIRMVDAPDSVSQLKSSLLQMMVADPFKLCMMHPEFLACASSYNEFNRALHGNVSALQARTTLRSSDIVLKQKNLLPSLTPVSDKVPKKPASVAFNHCIASGGSPASPSEEAENYSYEIYSVVVHETGHALGLSGFARGRTFVMILSEIAQEIDRRLPWINLPNLEFQYVEDGVYGASHPRTPFSVMNYDQATPSAGISTAEPDCAPHPLDILAIYALYQSVPDP